MHCNLAEELKLSTLIKYDIIWVVLIYVCSNFLKSDVDFNERDTMYIDFSLLGT